MTTLNGTIRIEPKDRLYEPVRNLLTLTACVAISATAFMSGNSDPKSLTGIGIIESKQFGLHIHVPNAGVMECAIRDLAPVELHHPKGHDRANRSVLLLPRVQSNAEGGGGSTTGLL